MAIKLGNFANAVKRLKDAVEVLKQNNAIDVVRDGVIQRFEFTYELAWKTIKEYLEDIGIVDRNSPKAVIKEAYAQKLITDEKSWLLMINDRNLSSHV
ncbi:MAG: HI0074 family nucleotidyltransferase substrate-binding subunit [Thermincolia bacterium]